MLPSIVRTLVPFLVALVGPWVARYLGVGTGDLSNVLTVLVGAGYYVAARALERVAPQFGWLLGHPAQPLYGPAAKKAEHL